ncbi:MAG: radical SAM protein [Syntrophobacteraceae bacterium]|nr:radical SAM protein [Syntrophobacteraceae bacterium]
MCTKRYRESGKTESTERGASPGAEREGRKVHAILLQPPPGDLTGPYPALAYLKASASRAGFAVSIKDLGIEALGFLTERGRIDCLLRKAGSLRKELEGKSTLNSAELHRYTLLVSAVGLEQSPDLVRDSMAVLKNREKFYDYRRYKKACLLVEAFYRLLSAVHFPTRVTSSEYPTVRESGSFENVMAHCAREVNPYIEYYEEVVFPYIAAKNPRVVGISMVFPSQSVQALVLGRMLKQRFPEVHVVLGGAYLSQWVLLMNDARLAGVFTCADSVVCGEGEGPFCELLDRVVNGRELQNVSNLIYLDRPSSAIRRFSTLVYADPADLPPPDYSDLDLGAYLTPQPVLPYCISRGCYWGRCAFCQNRYGDHGIRRYQAVPVEKALAEMSMLADRYGSNHFNFSNDAIDPGYLKRFSQALLDKGLKFIWNTDLRAEKAFTEELCRQMALAGLNCVAIGFESGCQKTLDAMDKGYEVQTVRQVMKNFYDAGIATEAMGIFGFPGETREDGELTVRFIAENVDRISYYVIGLLMVLPGSKLYENPHQYGISSISLEQNPLRTPEPVWRSESRMSARSVNYLYERLSSLEDEYAINDYPYVGALSTNHGFLYFRLGPDVLKRLRQEEKKRLGRLGAILGNSLQAGTAKFKLLVPRRNLPCTVYSSPFPVEEGRADQLEREWAASATMRDYLVDPVNMPIPVSPGQLKLLRRVDGHRNIKAILAKVPETGSEQLISFLLYLAHRGVIVATGL